MDYAGTWTALITPFKDGAVDEEAFAGLVRRQVENGVTGVLPVGTTGESPTLHDDEIKRLFEIAVEECGDEAMVMAGTGSNSTEKTVKMTEIAKAAGVDCCLVVTPYYNKPTQAGLIAHFNAAADVGLPVVVYNIAGRTGLNIDTDTLMEIAKHDNVVAVKEASGDMDQMKEVIARRPKDFAVLSGDDALTLELIKNGGDGVISVASNILPGKVSEMVEYARLKNTAEAEKIDEHLQDMFDKLFCETNPVPVKYVAAEMGLCELEYRLPMVPPSKEAQEVLDALINDYNL